MHARWVDGREQENGADLPTPSWHDDELLPIAQKILTRFLARRVYTMRLRLHACNLMAGYEQAVLFAPARQRQLEHVRDHLRQRFDAGILCSGQQLRAHHATPSTEKPSDAIQLSERQA